MRKLILPALLAVGLSLVLGACSATTTASVQSSAVSVQQFALADVQAADLDAIANKDTVAATCWSALAATIQAQAPVLTGPVPGAITAFQKARDVVNGSNAVLPALNVPCAPLLLDTQATLAGLAAKVGLGAVAVKIATPLVP